MTTLTYFCRKKDNYLRQRRGGYVIVLFVILSVFFLLWIRVV